DEVEATAPQVLAHGVGSRAADGDVADRADAILEGPAVDEAPDVGVEGAELGLDLQEAAGVADGGVDLEAVADDCRVGQEAADVARAEAGGGDGVEAGQGRSVG